VQQVAKGLGLLVPGAPLDGEGRKDQIKDEDLADLSEEELDRMLEREGRMGMAEQCFGFLPTRCRLDLAGWPEVDIFSH